MKKDLTITIFISILAIALGWTTNFGAFIYGGWLDPDKSLGGLMVTVVFLVALLVYGKVMGNKSKKGFIKFTSLYWVIGGAISLIPLFIEPIGRLAWIVIPIDILILVPTFGLTYFYTANTSTNTLYLVPIVSMIASWSAGAIGYLLGYFESRCTEPSNILNGE